MLVPLKRATLFWTSTRIPTRLPGKIAESGPMSIEAKVHYIVMMEAAAAMSVMVIPDIHHDAHRGGL
jgi:hypothetical protein